MKIQPTPKYFTLPNLITFLETYQPQGLYPVDSEHACMIAHFTQFSTRNNTEARIRNFPVEVIKEGEVPVASTADGKWFEIPHDFVAIAKAEPHTYPAALERAKRLMAEQAETSNEVLKEVKAEDRPHTTGL